MSQAAIDANLPGLALALTIGLLVGVDRGWQQRGEKAGQRVAGIRTFALLGLIGGVAGIGVTGPAAPFAILLAAGAVAALLAGYFVAVPRDNNVSATTTLAGIMTIGLGVTATTGNIAMASVGAGATMILLASREPLHRAIRATSESDIRALMRLVLVAFVILPLLPNRGMGPLEALNPFRLWTVIVVTGSISFIGYALVRWLGERRGAFITAAVGALVSSTAVTVEAARRIRDDAAGGITQAEVAIASSVMLMRSLVLVSVLAPLALPRFSILVLPGLAVSMLASAIFLLLERKRPSRVGATTPRPPGLGLAALFAASVALLSIASVWAEGQWGGNSGALLIALGGSFDIDAAIAAIGALPPGTLAGETAALALAAPTFLNTLFKLALFAGIAGPRRAPLGSAALAIISLALLAPVALALT